MTTTNNYGKYRLVAAVRRWTRSSVECFERNCKCEGCFLNDVFFKNSKQKCYMKLTVLELVRRFGVPKNVQYRKSARDD